MFKFYRNFFKNAQVKVLPNRWDGIAAIIVLAILLGLAWGAKQMSAPFELGQQFYIHLDPSYLAPYSLLTVLRMLVAMFFSLLFTFTIGTWAAKSPRAGRILIPIVDILQSVPVIGMLSISITAFITFFHGSRLGPECASIFTVFFSQAWNMTLSFYQSLTRIPYEMKETARMFHLNSWQKFWRIEVPFALPPLLWNAMLSMSASWFYVVISESISIANQQINLPGIGSYLGLAISQANIQAVFYAIIAMLIVIFLYDQLLFRPLLGWAEKFKTDDQADENTPSRSLISTLIRRSGMMRYISKLTGLIADKIINIKIVFNPLPRKTMKVIKPYRNWLSLVNKFFGYALLISALLICFYCLHTFILPTINFAEAMHIFLLGFYSLLRVLVTVLISSIIWVPIGVWIGLNPRSTKIVQPIAQFLAAFPANVLFPLVVVIIIKYQLDVDIYTTPLMLLGTQWYILFNVIAGASAIPSDLKQVARNFNLKGLHWWRRLILPAIFPAYIVGAMTAAGSAWNASVVAEVVNWGQVTLTAQGLGAYITQSSVAGDFTRVVVGMGVMCIFVLTTNALLWVPLYTLAKTKYRLS